MNRRVAILLLAELLTGAIAAGRAADPAPAPSNPEAGSKAETAKDPGWAFQPDANLPNVLLLGDSISIGYTLEVRKRLAGKANVFRAMDAHGRKVMNCNGTTFGLARLDSWLGDRKWDVIHFNWGLHDLKHVDPKKGGQPSSRATDPVQAPLPKYTANLEALVKRLKATGAKLIFATTTPVPAGCTNPLREPEAPARYNEAALAIMKTHGVRVNDLYAFALPRLEKIQLPKNVHFTPEGSEQLAGEVAAAIEAELKTPPASEARE